MPTRRERGQPQLQMTPKSPKTLPPALCNTFDIEFRSDKLGFRIAREKRWRPSAKEKSRLNVRDSPRTKKHKDSDELARVATVFSSSDANPEGHRISKRLKAGDYIVGVNGKTLLTFTFVEVVAVILQTRRPLTLRFFRPTPRRQTARNQASRHVGQWHSDGHKTSSDVPTLTYQPTAQQVLQASLMTEEQCRRVAMSVT